MSKPACVACGSVGPDRGFAAVEPGFEILRCASCGLGRTSPGVAESEIGRHYPESYYGKGNVRFNRLFEAMTRVFQRRRARVLRRRAARGEILDVGCGRGFLLSYMASMGFSARGVELSDAAAWHAREKLGLDVQTGDFLKTSHRPASFTAVVFWHTLEHFPRPEECLARAGELLRPGGLLAVAVPNSDSLQARLFGRHWFHLDVPRHYWHFTTPALAKLLARRGFRVVQLDHFCFEQNPFGWLQSFYNALGFEHNLLYTLLKAGAARTVQAWERPFQSLLIALLLPVLLPLSLLMTLVEAALRRGGTIEVYAVKE